MNLRASKRWLVVILPCVLAVGLLAILFVVRSSHEDRPSSSRKTAPPVESPEVEAERARQVGEFQKRHMKKINAKIDERLKADVTYSGSLDSLDEEFIQSMDGFTEAEKKEMWELVKAAKARAKKMKEGTAGQQGKKQ